MPVDLVLPVKDLRRAKTRLAPVAADRHPGADARAAAHRALALALAHDTLTAVTAADVRRVVVVTAEPAQLGAILPPGVSTITDGGDGLNAAVRQGAEHLRATLAGHPPGLVGALQADLPALRAAELDEALDQARHALAGPGSTVVAAFVPDHVGTGTTLLVTGPGRRPEPRFGPGSAAAHRDAGARRLAGPWPGLRTDVDTPGDLAAVHELGVGAATTAWVAQPQGPTPARSG